jgi:DNA polymerase III subunit delta'
MISSYPWLAEPFAKIRQDAESERLAHALLITGTVGSGTAEFSREIAAYMLCQSPGENACGSCKACQLFDAGSHPDLRLLEPEGAAKSIRVDQIRSLTGFIAQTPQIGSWKLVIIEMADRMNQNAANALLKMLEEPAGNSLILLATERPQMLLPTVRSRCSQIRIKTPSVNQSVTYLVGQGMSQEQAEQLVGQVGARPIQIQDWLEQDILPQWQTSMEKLQALDTGQTSAMTVASELASMDFSLLISWAMQFVAGRSRLLAFTDRGRSHAYLELFERLKDCRRELDAGTNPNPQLALEILFLQWQSVVQS